MQVLLSTQSVLRQFHFTDPYFVEIEQPITRSITRWNNFTYSIAPKYISPFQSLISKI